MSETEPSDRTKYCYDRPRPAVTVDVAVFCETAGELEVLLIERAREPFKGKPALPGGFVDPDEALEAAAMRELAEETGIRVVALEQIGAFGDPGRDPRGHTVSVAFTSLLDVKVSAKGSDDAAGADWYPAHDPPALAFDHDKILRAALIKIRQILAGRTRS